MIVLRPHLTSALQGLRQRTLYGVVNGRGLALDLARRLLFLVGGLALTVGLHTTRPVSVDPVEALRYE